MLTTNSTRFRSIAIALVLLFTFVTLALGLSIYYLAHLSDLDAIAQHAAAAQAVAAGTKQLLWFQGLALGTGILLLAALQFHLFHRLCAEETAVSEAQKKTQQILGTVSEGLFVLDRELTIGAEHSAALTSILHRDNLGGVKLPDLLRNMVPDETRTTALDFVDLLWRDRIEKDLIEDINPLDEIEVHFETNGGYQTRYLKFNFKRATLGTETTHIIVSVTDITKAVGLRQELAQERAATEAQIDLLMSTLHVSPLQLHAFIADSEMAVRQANEILKERAFKDEEFRGKIALLFNVIHGIKSDASGLGLPSIEGKAQALEDELQKLRERRELTGRDLLELPIKLDDLLSHFTSIRSLVDRFVTLRGAADAPSSSAVVGMPQLAVPLSRAADLENDPNELMRHLTLDPIEQTVRAQAERIAADLGKHVTVQTSGLETLPDEYRAAVKDAVVQLVRNAIVHGIELPADRAKANKPPVGVIKIGASVDTATNSCSVSVEDDGCGLSAKHILAAAIRKGIVTIEAAKTFSQMKAVLLIFEPGFSTVNKVTEHGGRGIGMDIIKTKVEGLGGRISIGGELGQRTVFRITLPMRRTHIAAA